MARRVRDRVFSPEDDPQGWREALDDANIPPRYQEAVIDKVTTSGDPPLRAWVQRTLDHPETWLGDGWGYVFCGPLGHGKSSVAGLFALDAVMRCEVVLWLAAREVPGVMFRDGGRNMALNERLHRADLLVIDDLGSEAYSMARAGGSALEGAIRTAYDRHRSLIVTTNISPGRMREQYPEPLLSVVERITELQPVGEA